MSSVPHHYQSPSTAGEDGWSTGSGESSYYSSSEETYVSSPDSADVEESDGDLLWRYANEGDEEEIQEETTLSYDAIEDGSEWVSESEKIARGSGHVLPTIEDHSSDDESSTWRFEVSLSTHNAQQSIASRDEDVAGRLESNNIRDGFDKENALSSEEGKTEPAASSTTFLPHKERADSPSTANVRKKGEQSKYDSSHSGSRVSNSGSSDREPNIPPDDSKSTRNEKSVSSSNLFILSSSSMQSSESPIDQSSVLDSSRSTLNDTSSAAEIGLSSSASESNLRSRSPRRRRRRQTRNSENSGYLATEKASAPRRPLANEINISNSASTGSQTSPSPPRIPRQKQTHPNHGGRPKPKVRAQRSSSNRRVTSRKATSSSASKPVEAQEKGINKFENRTRLRSKTMVHGRPRKATHNKPQASVDRHQNSRNSKLTSVGATTFALNSSDFKRSISFLRDNDCGLRTNTKRIHATVNNEGYKTFVRSAYYKLLEARPRLQYLLSLSEWLHVHMLLLYARLFDCELHFYGITLPQEFRIAIPENIVVFEPIATVLSSIGIIDETDIGITYIPVARSYRGNDVYKPHDKDDVTEFLKWNQYDWNASWYQVEGARLERRIMAAAKNIHIPKPEVQFDKSKLEDWQQLAVEKWLGWDDDLWFSYNQACYALGRCGHFVSAPRAGSKDGSYAWLLPRHTSDAGAFVRIPRPNLSHDCWMIALMLGMCALEDTETSTWYHETNSVDNVQHLIDSFLDNGMIGT